MKTGVSPAKKGAKANLHRGCSRLISRKSVNQIHGSVRSFVKTVIELFPKFDKPDFMSFHNFLPKLWRFFWKVIIGKFVTNVNNIDLKFEMGDF